VGGYAKREGAHTVFAAIRGKRKTAKDWKAGHRIRGDPKRGPQRVGGGRNRTVTNPKVSLSSHTEALMG